MRAVVSEGIGTGLLVAAVVGSGIMGERLAGGNLALALLANSVATGAVLVTLIFTFGPISGAHFNPAVSLAAAVEGSTPVRSRIPGVAFTFTRSAQRDVRLASVHLDVWHAPSPGVYSAITASTSSSLGRVTNRAPIGAFLTQRETSRTGGGVKGDAIFSFP